MCSLKEASATQCRTLQGCLSCKQITNNNHPLRNTIWASNTRCSNKSSWQNNPRTLKLNKCHPKTVKEAWKWGLEHLVGAWFRLDSSPQIRAVASRMQLQASTTKIQRNKSTREAGTVELAEASVNIGEVSLIQSFFWTKSEVTLIPWRLINKKGLQPSSNPNLHISILKVTWPKQQNKLLM